LRSWWPERDASEVCLAWLAAEVNPWMVIFVEVEAGSVPGREVSVLSDEALDGADAETLLTTEETIDRSTRHASQTLRQIIRKKHKNGSTYSFHARRPAWAP
jgi:hypothetical protein